MKRKQKIQKEQKDKEKQQNFRVWDGCKWKKSSSIKHSEERVLFDSEIIWSETEIKNIYQKRERKTKIRGV